MADMVSANTRAGSRPETKLSVQITLATKPVATFGTSRARAAVSASAHKAVVAERIRMRFRGFTEVSGMTQKRVPDKTTSEVPAARRIWKSPWPKLEMPRRFQNNAGIATIWRLGGRRLEPAVFGRRDARGGLESAVERTQRLEAGVHRDRNDRDFGLARVGQRRLGFGDPVLVEEHIEIAIAEPLVDQPPQPVFGNSEFCGQGTDADVVVTVDALVRHQPHQPIDELLVGCAGFDDRRA